MMCQNSIPRIYMFACDGFYQYGYWPQQKCWGYFVCALCNVLIFSFYVSLPRWKVDIIVLSIFTTTVKKFLYRGRKYKQK